MEALVGFVILVLAVYFANSWLETELGFNPLKALFRIIGFILKGLWSIFTFLSGLNFDWLTGKKDDLYGSAGFMEKKEQKSLLSPNHDGLTIDGINRITAKMSFENLLCVAPVGKGKTTKLIIPSVFNLSSSGIVTDPSGEIYRATAGYLSQDFNIKVLNLQDTTRSLCYNPLHRANTPTEIKQLCDVLIRSKFPNSTSEQRFWNTGAANILNILITCLKNVPDSGYHHLANVKHLLDNFGTNGKPLSLFFVNNAKRKIFAQLKGFIAQDEKVRLGQLSTAKVVLDLFDDPELAALSSHDNINFEDLRHQKGVVYSIVPEHQIKYYGQYLALFYTQLFEYARQSANPGNVLPLYFLLDEAGNMPIPDLASKITMLRKYEVSIVPVLQDESQLEQAFGSADAKAIKHGGCASHIYYPGLSYETCAKLEQALGHQTIEIKDNNSNRKMGKPLMTADEIRRLPDDEAIFIHSNLRPVKLKMTPYFKNPDLLRKSEIPAPVLPVNPHTNVKYLSL